MVYCSFICKKYVMTDVLSFVGYFSSGYRGAILASLVPGINAIRVLLIGLEVYKDEATVKSMSRFGDHR